MKAFASVVLLFAHTASACLVPPASIAQEHTSLLVEASAVLLVEAAAVPGDLSACHLRILHTFKDTRSAPVPVACRTPTSGDWMTDFSGHTESAFWQKRMGRQGVHGDCSVISPAFIVGKQYLVILGTKPDTKQFEQISGPKDQWLHFVEQTFPGQAK
jgi:hypothetical protein